MSMGARGELGTSWALQDSTSSGFHLSPFGSQQRIQQAPNQNSFVLSKATEGTATRFAFHEPIGRYPEGAKLLKGLDKSYVLAPIGHIIEEKYSPYLRFNA